MVATAVSILHSYQAAVAAAVLGSMREAVAALADLADL
jgi:hypothetical protein